jgi:hypothetical protein
MTMFQVRKFQCLLENHILTFSSEWENSDDAFSSSEVMESVTELGGVTDLTDDTQL